MQVFSYEKITIFANPKYIYVTSVVAKYGVFNVPWDQNKEKE